ncbi:hypothetical protein [Photobacterium damselae]|uniref:hypothetical protein n=1 Tax=Photobacterium damselae TaxID=38293 RepID=UPI0011D055F0|nr:hypothetical protein [Photobacterium damselae]KAB1510138.1 hypothetical protein FD717_011570 [Photobacterium damselae subsp. damselae]
MNKFEGIAMLKQQFRQLRLTTSKPAHKVNTLPRGCADFRYSRAFQTAAKRALINKIELMK